jgi:hypothetical protein
MTSRAEICWCGVFLTEATKGGAVEYASWMNNRIRREVENIGQAFGLEGQEAVAFWHLLEARAIMSDFTNEDTDRLKALQEQEYDAEALEPEERFERVLADNDYYAARFETTIKYPFRALFKVLGDRVLRRQYPDGWGEEFSEEDE